LPPDPVTASSTIGALPERWCSESSAFRIQSFGESGGNHLGEGVEVDAER
jgi:hypothetical protein